MPGMQMLFAMVNLGSASDRPFESSDETTLSTFVAYLKPTPDRNAWMYALVYSNNQALAKEIVIPAIAYVWRPSRKLTMLIGLPFFSMRWHPQPRWKISLSLNPAPGMNVSTRYRWSGGTEWFAAYRLDSAGYLTAERADESDRLFAFDNVVESGFTWGARGRVSFELAAGYGFERYLFEGESLFDRDDNRVDLADGAYLAARVVIRPKRRRIGRKLLEALPQLRRSGGDGPE
jgi:hypothetical protein